MMVPVPGSAEYGAASLKGRAIPSAASGPLVHGTHLVAGVHVAVDLMSPCRWNGVSYPASDVATAPLLRALIDGRCINPRVGIPSGTSSPIRARSNGAVATSDAG